MTVYWGPGWGSNYVKAHCCCFSGVAEGGGSGPNDFKVQNSQVGAELQDVTVYVAQRSLGFYGSVITRQGPAGAGQVKYSIEHSSYSAVRADVPEGTSL